MSNAADDAFLAFANQQEKEAAKRQATKGSTGERSFETIQWLGLERGVMQLIRFLGGVPDSKADKYTARSVRIAWLTGDDGKRFRVVFPDRSEAPDHILWRILARINQVEWQDGKKVLVVKEKYPTIYDIVAKNGLAPTDKRYMYERGWEGRQVLVGNVIGRSMYDWHRENKHTALLSRAINLGKEGQVFAEEGVPVYGFIGNLSNLFRYYGSWEKYDIGVERTGLKDAPYRIINASKHVEEVPASVRDLVVEGPLTEEELSWERYDLDKLFAYTSMTKIHNRLTATIAKIDAVLGTQFKTELTDAVAIEQEKWEAEKAAAAPEEASSPAPTVQETAPKASVAPRPRVEAAAPTPTFSSAAIPHWNDLSAAEKDAIVNVELSNGKLTSIIYKEEASPLYGCPSCNIPAPATFTICPACGEKFA